MKLAEALLERKALKEKLRENVNLAKSFAKVQEGVQPPVPPDEALKENQTLYKQLYDLVAAINKTNAQAKSGNAGTLAEKITQREILKLHIGHLEEVISEALSKESRYYSTDIRTLPAVNVVELRKELEDATKQYRELDKEIQKANWQMELLEK